VAAPGNVIVLDNGIHQVQVWGADGSFKHAFGSQGCCPGPFLSPWGVAVDASSGNIVVADFPNNRVQVWGADGSFKHAFRQHHCD